MSPAGLSQRERGILYIFIFFILVALVYKGFYLPFQARLEQADEQLSAAQLRLYKDQRLVQKAKNYEKKNQALLLTFTQNSTDEQVMSGIISEVEQVAVSQNLRISDMKPQRIKKIEGYSVFPISLSLEGEMLPLVKFIHVLQNAPHLFQVDEIRLERKVISSRDIKCMLSISRFLIQKP